MWAFYETRLIRKDIGFLRGFVGVGGTSRDRATQETKWQVKVGGNKEQMHYGPTKPPSLRRTFAKDVVLQYPIAFQSAFGS